LAVSRRGGGPGLGLARIAVWVSWQNPYQETPTRKNSDHGIQADRESAWKAQGQQEQAQGRGSEDANEINVVFELGEVVDGKVSGSAHYYAGPDFGRVEGNASGTFDGDVLDIFVWWPNKAYGEYNGHIDSTGHLAGVTRDLQGKNNPEVYWSSKQTFKCAQVSNAESVPTPPSGFNPNTPPSNAESGDTTLGIQSQHASSY
jgi:hypothetical protein